MPCCAARAVPSADQSDDVTATTDVVNHPAHYGGADNPYEAIKVIESRTAASTARGRTC